MLRTELEIALELAETKFPIGCIIITTKGCRTEGPFGAAVVYDHGMWAGFPQLRVTLISTGRKTTCLAHNAVKIKDADRT